MILSDARNNFQVRNNVLEFCADEGITATVIACFNGFHKFVC